MQSASRKHSQVNLDIVCVAILAGGQSTRMGQDKASLKINDETLLDYQTQRLKQCGFTHIVTSNHQGVADRIEQRGPVGAIHSLQGHLQNSQFEWLICCAVDMPLVRQQEYYTLLDAGIESGYGCYFEGNPLPCCLAINRHNFETAQQLLNDQTSVSLRHYYQRINCQPKIFSGDPEALSNANYPHQWEALKLKMNNE